MFKKSFVTIYFLENEIQIVQISPNKKSVKKFATVSLPQNLIKDSRVSDLEALSKIIKGVWKKLQIKEKSVFLVIPEISTFVKLFDIEGVEISDLSEAVGWQIHEYLPTDTKNLIVDWKIVNKEGKKFQVLAVALESSILEGFVRATENASLFPQVVEIPSLSLSRIVPENKNILVVYQTQEEILIGVFEKGKILASSVIKSEEKDELEITLKRLLNHFKEKGISEILVAGGRIDVSFFEKISKDFKVQLKRLTLPIKGIKEEEIENYLIPISASLQEPSEPSDPFSLNLLPGVMVEKYKRSKLKIQIWGLLLTVTLFVFTSFLLVLGSYLFLNQEIEEIKLQNLRTSNKLENSKEVDKKIQEINLVTERVVNIEKISVLPQEILNLIFKAKVEGIVINEYSIDFDKGLVKISGLAANRNALLNFKQNLQTNSNISQIEVPISSFEKDVDLEYEISFQYLPLAGKTK